MVFANAGLGTCRSMVSPSSVSTVTVVVTRAQFLSPEERRQHDHAQHEIGGDTDLLCPGQPVSLPAWLAVKPG